MVSFAQVRHWQVALSVLLCAACSAQPPRVPAPSTPQGPDRVGNEPARSASLPGHAGEPALDDSGESEHESDSDDERPDDGELPEPAPGALRPHPLDGWSEERIERAVTTDLASLGPMSVGTPNAGGLVNGVQALASPLYSLVSPGSAWGTQETIDYLNAAVQAVHEPIPGHATLGVG